jgi:biotin operon repressor
MRQPFWWITMSASKAKGKPAKRKTREAVVHEIRHSIVSGAYVADQRLPTAETLADQLGTSYVTVLHGMDALRDEGFIVSNRRTGSFVAEFPPHLYEAAMVIPFPNEQALLDEQPFFKLLCDAAEQDNAEMAPWRVRPWFCERDPQHPSGLALSKANASALVDGAIAGLIFPFNPAQLEGTPLLDQPDIARVTVDRVKLPGVSRVCPDHLALLEGALDRVHAAGRSRVAIAICSGFLRSTELSGGEKRLREEVSRRGLRMRPYDLISIDLPFDQTNLRRIIHMMFDRPAGERPDALILMDDQFIPGVGAGVVDADVKVPEDVLVMGYCNFPHRPKSLVPLRRFGYDAPVLLNDFVEAIEDQRQSGNTSNRRLEPVFEDK